MKKSTNKTKKTIIFISIVSGIIIFSLILFLTVSYFSSSKNIAGNITLGELDFNILVSSKSEKLLAGDYAEVNVTLENKVNNKNLVPFYFRFCILNNNENYSNNFVSLLNNENFTKSEKYFYYNNIVNINETIFLINKLFIDENFSEEDAKNSNFEIFIEAVQAGDEAYKEVFYDAPKEWFNEIKNK